LRAVDVRLTAEAVLDLTAHLSDPAREAPSLINSVPPGTPLVRADAHRLLQMMLNLVHEALQRTGTEAVELTAEPDAAGRMLWIAVTRRGADASHEERLETAVSRKLAELHGGELHVAPLLPSGTIVRFSLPIEQTGVLPEDVLPGRTAGGVPAWLESAAAAAPPRSARTGRGAGSEARPAGPGPDAPRVLLAD